MRILTGLILALVLAGCGQFGGSRPCTGRSLPQLMETTALKPLFDGIARDLCVSPCGECAGGSCPSGNEVRPTVLVTDFVDLESYQPGSPGLLMGELTRAALNNACCHRIVQAEFGRHFSLSDKGLVSLTRRADDVRRDDYPYPEAIVGTYGFRHSKLVIFARRIDTASGQVSRMVTREVDYRCDGARISHDIH